MQEKISVIVDHVGRTVLGVFESETDTTLTLNNPVILHVQPDPNTGQLSVRSFPYLFMEFLTPESKENNLWTFNKSNIVTSTVTLDERIVLQYKSVNVPQAPPQPQGEPEVIKLFGD